MSPHNPNLFPSTHACSHISLFSGSPFCPRTRSTCGGGKKCSRDIDLATRARLLGAPDGVDGADRLVGAPRAVGTCVSDRREPSAPAAARRTARAVHR